MEGVCVEKVDFFYLLIINGGFLRGEFCKVVKDS